MPDTDLSTYVAAYEGILTPEQLQRSLSEKTSHGEAVSGEPGFLNSVPAAALRFIGDHLVTLEKQLDVLNKNQAKAREHGYTYPEIVNTLNNQVFVLEHGSRTLAPGKSDEFHEYFPAGQKQQWPALVLTTNSDLTSPVEFYNGFEISKEILKKAAPDLAQKDIVVMGAYHSEDNFSGNSLHTLYRYDELATNPQAQNKVTINSTMLAERLLGILVQRDSNGKAIGQDSKPALRADSTDILRHVAGYGYSSGDLAVNDAFRILGKKITDGQVIAPENAWGVDKNGNKILTLFANARDIGVAGLDNRTAANNFSMPQRMNFVSPGDGVVASQGSALYNASGTHHLPRAENSGLRYYFNKLVEPALETSNAGHDQTANAKAAIQLLESGARIEFYSDAPVTPVQGSGPAPASVVKP